MKNLKLFSLVINNKYIFFILLVVILMRILFVFIPLDRDGGTYAYIGWRWLSYKETPYLEVFDNKPPVTYLIYGLISSILGKNYLAINIYSVATKIIESIIFYFIGLNLIKGKFSSQMSLLSTIVFIFYQSSIRLEGNMLNTENLLTLPLLLAILLIVFNYRQNENKIWRVYLAGMLLGLSLLIKTNIIFALWAIILWFILRKKLNYALYIISGVFTIMLFFGIYFWYHKALSELIYDVFIYNNIYIKSGWASLHLCGKELPSLLCYLSFLTRVPPVLYGLVAVNLIFFIQVLGSSDSDNKNLISFIILLIFALFLQTKAKGSVVFPHDYLPLTVGLVLSTVLIFYEIFKKNNHINIILIFAFLLLWQLAPELKYLKEGPKAIFDKEFGGQASWFLDALEVGNWMKDNTDNKDTLLVWANEPEIYFYSEKKSLTKYINFYGMWYVPGEEKKWEDYLSSNLPNYIVTYTNDPPTYVTFNNFLEQNPTYNLDQTIGTYYVFKKIVYE